MTLAEELRLKRIEERTAQAGENSHALEVLGAELGSLDSYVTGLPRWALLRRRRAMRRMDHITDDMIGLRDASHWLLAENCLDLALVTLTESISRLAEGRTS